MIHTIIDFFLGHGAVYIVAGFTFASAILTALASCFTALGDSVPGWIGTAISFCAKVLHLVNGNFTALSGPSDKK